MTSKNTISELRDRLDAFDDSPLGAGMDLRLSLAELILVGLKAKGWTQRQFANEAELKEPFISRILHSNVNCTLDTAARLLHALGVRARIQETERVVKDATPVPNFRLVNQDTAHGQEDQKTYKSQATYQIC